MSLIACKSVICVCVCVCVCVILPVLPTIFSIFLKDLSMTQNIREIIFIYVGLPVMHILHDLNLIRF